MKRKSAEDISLELKVVYGQLRETTINANPCESNYDIPAIEKLEIAFQLLRCFETAGLRSYRSNLVAVFSGLSPIIATLWFICGYSSERYMLCNER